MTELSTAALAVLNAYWKADPERTEYTDAYEVAGIAAALRAAAYQVAPAKPVLGSCCDRYEQTMRHKLLAIADELEKQ